MPVLIGTWTSKQIQDSKTASLQSTISKLTAATKQLREVKGLPGSLWLPAILRLQTRRASLGSGRSSAATFLLPGSAIPSPSTPSRFLSPTFSQWPSLSEPLPLSLPQNLSEPVPLKLSPLRIQLLNSELLMFPGLKLNFRLPSKMFPRLRRILRDLLRNLTWLFKLTD